MTMRSIALLVALLGAWPCAAQFMPDATRAFPEQWHRASGTAADTGDDPVEVNRALAAAGRRGPRLTVRGVVRAVLATRGRGAPRLLVELEVSDPMQAAPRVKAGQLVYLRALEGARALSFVPAVDQDVIATFDACENGPGELATPAAFAAWIREVPR